MDDVETPEPLPCPFCGALPEIAIDDVIGEWFVACPTSEDVCPIATFGGPFITAAGAVEAWNRRAPLVKEVSHGSR